MRSILLIPVIFLISNVLLAQQTGLIDYPNLGLKFNVPEGWVGQESEIGFIMGSNTIPGIVLLMTIQVQSIEQLKREAQAGIADQNGTQLNLSGPIQNIGTNVLGGIYSGTLEWQPAKAFIIGKLNSGKFGVTIMVATSIESYSQVHEETCREIANSLQFYQPVVTNNASDENWSELLKNARLTYMDSHYSSGGSYGDSGYSTGGGYSNKVVIDLCAQGFFNHSQSSSISYDAGAASVGSGDQNSGAGKWKVIKNPAGQSFLQLSFHNNEVHEYALTLEDNKTYLDGSRYYRTYGESRDDGPDCN